MQVARVRAVACTPPRIAGCRLARWSCPELVRHVGGEGICTTISPATIRRWPSEDALKPWQFRSWIFITDPGFAAKAARLLDLHARTWDGKPLSDNDYDISADEKTSIQARCRCNPTLPSGGSRGAGQPHLLSVAARSPTWPPTMRTRALLALERAPGRKHERTRLAHPVLRQPGAGATHRELRLPAHVLLPDRRSLTSDALPARHRGALLDAGRRTAWDVVDHWLRSQPVAST